MAARDATELRPSEQLMANVVRVLGWRVRGAHLLSRVHYSAHDMMSDRGMRVIDACASEEHLLQRIDQGKPVLRAESDDARTLVYVDPEERTGVKLVRTLCDQHADADICLIGVSGPTPFAKREFAGNARVEFWLVSELLFNPTRHALVPKHTLLSNDEVRLVQWQRCILPDQWPTICAGDIIVRWHKFPKDGVVRVTRTGFGCEQGDFYRKVR